MATVGQRRTVPGALLKGLRRYWWILVAATVAGGVLGVGISLLQTKLYEATSQVVVRNSPDILNQISGGSSGPYQDPNRLVTTQAKLVTLPTVIDRVTGTVGADRLGTRDVKDSVTVETAVNSDILTIRVRWTDPETAQQIATVLARQFVAYRSEQDTAALSDAEKEIERRIAELQGGAGDAAYLAELRQTQLDLSTRILIGSRNAQVVALPDAAVQVQPRPKLLAVLGALAGLLVGLLIVSLLQLVDRHARSPEDVEEILGAPLLAAIPRRSRRHTGSDFVLRDSPSSLEAEAFRVLAATLRLGNVGGRKRALLVVSAQPSEGKSTTAVNLGAAVARSGQRVVVCDVDLHRPRIASILGIAPLPGVTNVLSGQSELEEAIRPVPLSSGEPWHLAEEAASGAAGPASDGGFSAVPSGPIPPNPGDFTASPQMGALVANMKAASDMVILDAPPWLLFGDAVALAQSADGIIVVVRSGATTRRALRSLRQALDLVSTPILGFVLTGWGTKGSTSSYKYYAGGRDDDDIPTPFMTSGQPTAR